MATYDAFAERVQAIKARTLDLLQTLRSDGRRIVGYGAPAEGNTLLNPTGWAPIPWSICSIATN